MTVLNNRVLKARKIYYDNGLEQVENAIDILNFSDRMYIYKLKKKRGYKIQIGETYLRQIGVYEGFYTFRTTPKIFDIICKYKLFPDD